MTNVNVAAYYTNGGLAHLNGNGRIETPVRFNSAGAYTFEVVAGGDAAAGVLPQIGITVNGASRTNFFLTTTNLARYAVTLSLPAGTHKIGLAFLNDFYAPPQDRNARFDRLTLTRPLPPRLITLQADPTRSVATLQWEAGPGKTYNVLVATNLAPSGWQTVHTLPRAGTWQAGRMQAARGAQLPLPRRRPSGFTGCGRLNP